MKLLDNELGAATPRPNKNNCTVIIPEKEINYIETLYIYYTKKYEYYEWFNLLDFLETNYSVVGYSHGRFWFLLDGGIRLGLIDDYEKCLRSNQYFVLLQYDFEHLFPLQGNLSLLQLPSFLSQNFDDYIFKRVDVTKVAQYKKPLSLDPKETGFITQYKYNYYNGTVYLGSRNNGCVTRIYNKSLELLEQSSHKQKYFLEHFDNLENLYTIELELHRSYLRKNFDKVQRLSDWRNLFKIYNLIVGKIKMFDINDKNMRNYRNNNRSRIPCKTFTEFEFIERKEKVKYSRSYKRLINNIVSMIDEYFEDENIPKTNVNYMNVIEDVMRARLSIKGKNLIINFEDTPLSDDIKAFEEKMERIRYKGDDLLFDEAKKYFGFLDKNA